jgi:hypothetical protein
MSDAAIAAIVTLFLFALAGKFISDAATNPTRKLLWRRTWQGTYLVLVILLVTVLAPLVWPFIKTSLN